MIDRFITAAQAIARELRRGILGLESFKKGEWFAFWNESHTLFDRADGLTARLLRDAQIAGWVDTAENILRRADIEPQGFSNPFISLFDHPLLPKSPISLANVEAGARNLIDLKAMTRDRFDMLEDDARNTAFTVARVAKESTVKAVQNVLVDAVRSGDTFRTVKPKLTEALNNAPLGVHHVESLYRTYVGRAQTAGMVETLTNPMVRDEFPYLLWSATHDGRTEKSHLDMEKSGLNGTAVYRADDPIWYTFLPPCRWNSVVPGTIIEGAVQYASKAFYSGDILKLATKSGRTTTVTANHPILTCQGFIPAKSLVIGENLLSKKIPISGSSAPVNNVNNSPSRIDEVFQSLHSASGSVAIERESLNLDAEFNRGYSDIEVVAVNRELLNNLNPQIRQRFGNVVFPFSNSRPLQIELSKRGTFFEKFIAMFLSSCRFPDFWKIGRIPKNNNLIFRSFGTSSNWDVRRQKPGTNGGTADNKIFRELIFRHPGEVIVDELIRIDVQHYEGLVYDVQTKTGYMTADGIVAKNCRCNVTILSLEDAAAYGVKEAIDWMNSGRPPIIPQYVKWVPLVPVKGWVPTGARLAA